MSELDEADENTLSIGDLRKEVRRCWDRESAFVKSIKHLDEVPPYNVLMMLSRAARFPDDGTIGKKMQAGGANIPFKTEAEMGAGLWSLMISGVRAARKKA